MIEMNKILVACYTEIINEKVYEDTGLPPGSSLYRDKNKKLILKSQEIGSLLN